MPPTDPDKIADLAQALLDSVVGELIDPPERRFRTVSSQRAPWECPFVAVRLVDGARGLAGNELTGRVMCADTWTATLIAEVVRDCWPVGDGNIPPEAADIDAAAVLLYRDAWSLMQGVHRAANAEEWKSACMDVTLGRLNAYEPQGGYNGVGLDVTVELL